MLCDEHLFDNMNVSDLGQVGSYTELPAGVSVVGKSFVENNRGLRLVRWNPTSARAQQGDPRLGLAQRALR